MDALGVGRFTISLYGEAKRKIQKVHANNNAVFISRNKIIVDDYIEGLKTLADIYDDKSLLNFVNDFQNSNLYINGFNKTIELAKRRNVSEDKMMTSKTDIDLYFQGGH